MTEARQGVVDRTARIGHAPCLHKSFTKEKWNHLATKALTTRAASFGTCLRTTTPRALRRQYGALVATYHPDRVAGLGAKLQRLAEDETKALNEAYAWFKARTTDGG